MSNLEIIETKIKISYGINDKTIPADVLQCCLSELIIIINEINNLFSEEKIKIYVLPFENGSFIKKLLLVGTSSFTFAVGLSLPYTLKNKSLVNVIVSNNKIDLLSNNKIDLSSLEQNLKFLKSRSDLFKKLKSSEKEINNLQIETEYNNEIEASVKIEKENYNDFILNFEDEKTEKQIFDIKITRPYFSLKTKKYWSAEYLGEEISFPVKDLTFLENMISKNWKATWSQNMKAEFLITITKDQEGNVVKKNYVLDRVIKFDDYENKHLIDIMEE
jgi:hypothetical protein